MLRARIAPLAVLTSLLLTATAPVLAPPPAHAETLVVPGSTSAALGATSTLEIAVPPGVTPAQVTGRLRLDDTIDGTVAFVVGGRLAARVPARAQAAVTIPVGRADVVDDRIQVEVRVDPEVRRQDAACVPVGDVRATLDQVRLEFTGAETAPATLAEFLAPYATAVDVVVPADAGEPTLAAGLTAVAAISSRYPDTTTVRLTTPDDVTKARTGLRVVRLAPGTGTATTAITDEAGAPTLTLTGGDDELAAAARGLGDEALGLADADRTEGLAAERATGAPVDELTLAQLGVSRAVLSGYGRVEQYVGIRQDAFGGPVGSLRIDLNGTHTALPEGARAQLDVYVNDRLVDSTRLGDDPVLRREIEVPAADLQGDNGMVVVLSALPPREWCTATDRQLPLEVHLDTERTVVHAERGDARTTGFAAYPQNLGGRLAVGISDHAADPVAAAVDAGQVVAALQRRASRPLDVRIVPAADLRDGTTSGLLVGAGEDDSKALKAPLRLSEMRLLDYAEATFQVGTDQPYAALVAVRHRGRDVLMLGSWAPDGDGAALERRAATYLGAEGWGALSANLLVQPAQGEPFSIDADAVVPQQERVDEQRSFAWWLVGGLAVLLVLLGGRWLLARRRRQEITEIVDAQVAADADPTGDDDRP